MIKLAELTSFVRDAAQFVARERDVAGFELYAAASTSRIARLCYTSDIPCRGVEEMKSLGADGFQVRIVMRRNPQEVGTAYEAAELSRDALKRALDRARDATVVDPHFSGFAIDSRGARGTGTAADLARASDAALTSCAWTIVGSSLAEFGKNAASRSSSPGLVIGGDVSIVHDRIAVTNSNLSGVRSDESAHFSASVTSIIESIDAKGTASGVGSDSRAMRLMCAALGRDSVRSALKLGSGVRPPSGKYRVLFGPQPIAEILNYMVIGSLTSGAFFAASSAYHGRFGDRVMDERLSLFDDPGLRDGIVRRRITCEGLAAHKLELIRRGKLLGLFSNVYDSHRLETDGDREEKLGSKGRDARFAPSNGYRIGEAGGRRFDASAGSAATNVVLHGRGGVGNQQLIKAVGDGIYVGRIWYTYPINGQRAGDFTCTVTGDSYRIRDGKVAEPLAPNCLRINANIAQVFDAPLAIGARVVPITIWGDSAAYYVPPIAAPEIQVVEVGASN